MNNYSWKKHYAVKQKFESEFNWVPERPGIYLWTRFDPNINKTYFYIGQAQNLRNRRFDYYKIQTGLAYPTRHFEASLKAHNDWKYQIKEECPIDKLNEREQYWIKEYMKYDNHITRNDSLTGSDITKTNANRITKIKKEYEEAMQKCINNLEIINVPGKAISFNVKANKDGSFNKRSVDSLKTLTERLGIKNE